MGDYRAFGNGASGQETALCSACPHQARCACRSRRRVDPGRVWIIRLPSSPPLDILWSMSRTARPPLPGVARALTETGENTRLARRRRKLSASLVAARAGMTRPTLRAIERGEFGVTLGSYANVLHCLGLEKDLDRKSTRLNSS